MHPTISVLTQGSLMGAALEHHTWVAYRRLMPFLLTSLNFDFSGCPQAFHWPQSHLLVLALGTPDSDCLSLSRLGTLRLATLPDGMPTL